MNQFVKFQINMKKLYLTVRINADDIIFNTYSMFNRINLGRLNCSKTRAKEGPLPLRAQCIFEHISAFPDECFLIGYGLGAELDDYLELKMLLASVGRNLDKVFVSKKRARTDIHENYSNWTGYSPADINYMEDIYFEKLERLLDVLKSDGVEVIVLFN